MHVCVCLSLGGRRGRGGPDLKYDYLLQMLTLDPRPLTLSVGKSPRRGPRLEIRSVPDVDPWPLTLTLLLVKAPPLLSKDRFIDVIYRREIKSTLARYFSNAKGVRMMFIQHGLYVHIICFRHSHEFCLRLFISHNKRTNIQTSIKKDFYTDTTRNTFTTHVPFSTHSLSRYKRTNIKLKISKDLYARPPKSNLPPNKPYT